MKKRFYTILHYGIEPHHTLFDKRRIKTINLINLIMAAFLLIGFTNAFFIKDEFGYLQSTCFLILCLISLSLSRARKTDLAFILFTLNVNLSIFHVNEYYPREVGAYLFYFPVIVSIVLLSKPSFKNKFTLIHLITCLAFFLAALLLDFPDYKLKNLSQEQMQVLWYYDFIMSVSLTALISFLLTRIIYTQNREIVQQNESLQTAQNALHHSLKEKEVLLAELHPRVKNNLAIILGLLNLQEDSVLSEEAKQVIGDSKTRIMSMALVHKMLFENPHLKSIDIARYASELISELFRTYDLNKTVRLHEDYDNVVLPVTKSIPFGLILNEVVTNSIKYVFKSQENKAGRFDISIKNQANKITVVLKDNGTGFPKSFNPQLDTTSLGISLMKTLTEQLDGDISFSNDNGAKIELNFSAN
ncbi:MAG: sensor histidine kinase [Bacteroidia bacterium]|nr:sensor histidine kinase [Bacteroidia bacterium]